ncbi:MerR family transcriptional regulator [Ureibacillus aquaedulcis]|uniref:MerR family transcriptional regulator n=1 Tax=Ureibacillus aquaedulcis TaxID=3058421 RepID=A0ABT8GW43_9BACL|nr:MerR family transcriptional regulator [Ureibacillus sp. BA0131]MDN4495621.1 MerR family transcriptional regulator [Ureibacillus sp. BA0131]
MESNRNSRNHREYTQHDLKILKAMQYLNREKSMSLEDSASKVSASDFDPNALLSQQLPQIAAQDDAR